MAVIVAAPAVKPLIIVDTLLPTWIPSNDTFRNQYRNDATVLRVRHENHEFNEHGTIPPIGGTAWHTRTRSTPAVSESPRRIPSKQPKRRGSNIRGQDNRILIWMQQPASEFVVAEVEYVVSSKY